jgi:hypothetical protein
MVNAYLLHKRLEVIHKEIEARKNKLEADLEVLKTIRSAQQWKFKNVEKMNKAELKLLYDEKKMIDKQIVASCLANLAEAVAAAAAAAAATASASDALRKITFRAN